MSNPASTAVSLALIGAGALAWAGAGHPVVRNGELHPPLNPMGIHRSPYGEVIAMAMQGPIDTTYFKGATDTYGQSHLASSGGQTDEVTAMFAPPVTGFKSRFQDFISGMAAASVKRTNPYRTSKDHDFHIRRKVEDKLRFAYQLDPSHYGNYNSYHFFLTEPQMGTRPELTPGAAKLADDTIRYCLEEPGDPRPALTAAAAACNVLHLMFADRRKETPTYTVSQMRQTLDLLDRCIARHLELAEKWEASGEKELLSTYRILEMEDRLSFVIKIRDAGEKAIHNFESNPFGPQASN